MPAKSSSKPRGRPPRGTVWSEETGAYISVGASKAAELVRTSSDDTDLFFAESRGLDGNTQRVLELAGATAHIAKLFREEEIDWVALCTLRDEDLLELGVGCETLRARLLEEVQCVLCMDSACTPASPKKKQRLESSCVKEEPQLHADMGKTAK